MYILCIAFCLAGIVATTTPAGASPPADTNVRRNVAAPSNHRAESESSDLTPALLALAGGILVALIGAGITYLNNLRIARRKDALDRLNAQLRLLYGPLYASDLAARESWWAFWKKLRPGIFEIPRDQWAPLTNGERIEWRIWMTHVFMPLNERIERAIVENADLLPEEDIPQPLLDMCAHVASYKALLKKWELQDYSEDHAQIDYPGREFREYIQRTFKDLKQQQAKLLALR
jgi:hypothetical protein